LPLQALGLERLHGVNDAVLKGPVPDAQNVHAALVAVLVQALLYTTLGIVAAGCRRARHVLVLWEALRNNVRDLAIAEIACHSEKALAGRVWLFECSNVGFRYFADVHPKVYAGWCDLVLPFALCSSRDALVRCV
jgi:hypothetical protein